METLARIALALLAHALADAAPAAREAAAPAETTREEHFVLEIGAEGELGLLAGPERAQPVGLAVCRRRREPGGDQVEWEIRFHEGGVADTRVLHVERLMRERSKLVWRTWREGSGRTLVVEWTAAGDALRVLEWGREETLRETVPVGAGAVMPLYLQELARAGRVQGGGRFRLFDPLSRRLEPVRVDCFVNAAAAPGAEPRERWVELRRDDGTLAAAWIFEGEDLRAFQWQAGGVRGRRIDRRDYLRRLERVLSGGE